jgi:hypothetical protein
MEPQGYKANVLADLLERGVYTSGGDLMTSRQFLKEKRDLAKSFLKALCEAIGLGRKDKELALRVYRKYLKIDEPQLLESIHKNYVLETFAIIDNSRTAHTLMFLVFIDCNQPFILVGYDGNLNGLALRPHLQLRLIDRILHVPLGLPRRPFVRHTNYDRSSCLKQLPGKASRLL